VRANTVGKGGDALQMFAKSQSVSRVGGHGGIRTHSPPDGATTASPRAPHVTLKATAHQLALQIFSMFVPPGAPIGSPQVMA
jgi:hypothetical protein